MERCYILIQPRDPPSPWLDTSHQAQDASTIQDDEHLVVKTSALPTSQYAKWLLLQFRRWIFQTPTISLLRTEVQLELKTFNEITVLISYV